MRPAFLLPLVVLWAGLPSTAGAETAEQRYFAARDAAVVKVTAAMDAYTAMPSAPPQEKAAPPEKGKVTAQDRAKAAAADKAKAAAFDKAKAAALDKVLAMDKAERAKLEEQMREMVGPISINGFDKDGTLNLDALIKGDQGFGTLDGLAFTSTDKKASVIVTTTAVFRQWLAEHKDWWGKNSNDIPQQPGRAIKENAFYTQALVTDSAIMGFVELPVRKPLGTVFVFAMLGGRTQDATPSAANEIFFAVARGGHAFIGQSRNFTAVGPVPACEPARKAALDYRPSTDKKAKDLEGAFLKCFASRSRFQPNYAEAMRAAQQLVDSVAAR